MNLVEQVEIQLKGEANRHSTANERVTAVYKAVEPLAAKAGEIVRLGPVDFEYWVPASGRRVRKLFTCFVSRYNLATLEICPSVGDHVERLDISHMAMDQVLTKMADAVARSLAGMGRFTL